MTDLRLHKNWPYPARLAALVIICTFLNLIGLFGTEEIGWSILFFDMVGTAVASLLSGATAGILVAVLTGWIGSRALGHPQYFLFSMVNIGGALLWAVVPRMGRASFGGELFNPSFPAAYRRGMLNIVILGFAVGVCCSILAFVIQTYVIPLSSVLHGAAPNTVGAGTATARNINFITRSIITSIGTGDGTSSEISSLISSVISNVPDKIIATVTAVILIFSFGTLPNYQAQKKAMREDYNFRNSRLIDNRPFFGILLATSIAIILERTYVVTQNMHSLGMMALLSMVIGVFCVADLPYLRSIDRRAANSHRDSALFFFDIPDNFDLRKQKDIFEDMLKMMVVIVSGISFLIASQLESGKCVGVETVEALISCGSLYRLAVINVVILTGFRYSFIMLIRMSGRV